MLCLEQIRPGLSAVVQKMVQEGDTAAHHGGGALGTLLATPAYVELMISAAVEAVDKHLPEGFITVGKSMSFTHEQATSLGLTVSVKAAVKEVDGNRIFFDITACDEAGQIGYGSHERIVVNRDQMLAKVKQRVKFIQSVTPK